MKRVIAIATALLWLLMPATALAYNPLTDACGSGGGSAGSAACTDLSGKDPITGPNGILTKASLILATIAGIAAVIIIMVSGFRYITANGDANKAASARNGIIGAAVGLVIIAAAESIVILVVRKL